MPRETGALMARPGVRKATLDGTITLCRSIKTLREPFTENVTEADVRAAALQYIRKISGFRAPAGHNAEAFEHAVAAVTEATRDLLGQLEVRGQRAAAGS